MKHFKHLLALMVSIIIISALTVDASEIDWKLSANFHKTVASDVESIVQSGEGVQVSLHRNSLFLYLSKDINQVRFAGQGGPDVNLWSAGIGAQRKIVRHLTLSVDAGWYEPRFRKMGKPQDYYSSPFAEGLCRYMNAYLADRGDQGYYPDWDYYTLTYQGAIGGKLSLAFEYPITDRLSFNATAGYRYLKLLENVTGQDYDGGYERLGEAGYWTTKYERDFSGFMVGGMFVVAF